MFLFFINSVSVHQPPAIYQQNKTEYICPFLLLQGSKGNTALHFACLLEKVKHAEMLIAYGANIYASNEHGQVPLQLLPRDSVRSTKLQFKKIFEVRNVPVSVYLCLCACVIVCLHNQFLSLDETFFHY